MSEKTIAKKQTYRVALFYNKMPPPFQNGGGILVRPTGFEGGLWSRSSVHGFKNQRCYEYPTKSEIGAGRNSDDDTIETQNRFW